MHTLRLDAANPEDVSRAAAILRDGGLVAFPTETVYGLGANALNASAVERIFVAKRRPHWDPLIVHISDREMLRRVALPVERMAEKLIDRYWPGPLTLLLPRTPLVPEVVTAGRPLVGVRMPRHAVALQLIRQAGVPIAAPSANTFGHTSPTTAGHVLADLDGCIDAVLDGRPTELGVESTVVEVVSRGAYEEAVLYRAGGVTVGMLESVLGDGGVLPYQVEHLGTPVEELASPGVSLRHYAPRARLVLVGVMEQDAHVRAGREIEGCLVGVIDNETTEASRVGVLLPDDWNASSADLVFRWGPWSDHDCLARRLYAGMRELDERGATVIVCPLPWGTGLSDAIQDRLEKAAR